MPPKKDYVVYKCAFTSSNSVWVTMLTPYDEIFMYTNKNKAEQKVQELAGAETGSGRLRVYKWEHIPGFEENQDDQGEDEQ